MHLNFSILFIKILVHTYGRWHRFGQSGHFQLGSGGRRHHRRGFGGGLEDARDPRQGEAGQAAAGGRARGVERREHGGQQRGARGLGGLRSRGRCLGLHLGRAGLGAGGVVTLGPLGLAPLHRGHVDGGVGGVPRLVRGDGGQPQAQVSAGGYRGGETGRGAGGFGHRVQGGI